MRQSIFLGLLLVILGGVLFFRGTFTTRKKVLEVGDVRVTAPVDHRVPQWAAGLVVLAGVGLVVLGAAYRGRA